MRVLLAILLTLNVFSITLLADETRVGLGREEKLTLFIEGQELKVKEQKPEDAVYMRIVSSKAKDNGYEYELYVMPLVEGEHNLADFLAPVNYSGDKVKLKAIPYHSKPAFSASNSQLLKSAVFESPKPPFRYSWMMFSLIFLWVLCLVPIFLLFRKKKENLVEQREEDIDLLKLLRELSEIAMKQGLSNGDKARLERISIRYWSEKKQIENKDLKVSLEELQKDPEIAVQLTLQEKWLFAPNGQNLKPEEVLASYLNKSQEARA